MTTRSRCCGAGPGADSSSSPCPGTSAEVIVETMVLVGADRVGARHDVQLARPPFLVVGATDGAGTILVSEHPAGDPCAACLHPEGETEDRRVPTASFASFWAGYLAALRILRGIEPGSRDSSTQVTRCYPLQPQSTVEEPATRRPDCEVCGGASSRTVMRGACGGAVR